MAAPMRIAYFMEDTDLSGGVRVQLAQADALITLGHELTIITCGTPLTWRGSNASWLYVDSFTEVDSAPFDFLVGTFWTTVRPAYDLDPSKVVHLSQGYEGAFSFYQEQKALIDAVYSLPIPKLVVSRPLIPILQKFGDDITFVGQIVDESFYRSSAASDIEPLRVLLSGPFQIDLKGIDDGYGAVNHARWHGYELDLVRVSPWGPSGSEPADLASEFHVALSTTEMTRLMHSCDILLAPNHHQEGFGLPAAEAMASGVPVIMTRIPSYLAFDEQQDYALFANEGDAEGLGDCLMEMLDKEDLRRTLRKRGREVAEQFREEHVAGRLQEFFLSRRQSREPRKVQAR
ncbi:MAG: glycosyltransferase family 4 protein [Acidobacteriota bacterium]